METPTNFFLVGQSGLILTISVSIDLSELSSARLDVVKPDGKTEQWGPVNKSGESKLAYELKDGDIDIPGQYVIFPYVEAGNFSGHLTPVSFVAYPVPEA